MCSLIKLKDGTDTQALRRSTHLDHGQGPDGARALDVGGVQGALQLWHIADVTASPVACRVGCVSTRVARKRMQGAHRQMTPLLRGVCAVEPDAAAAVGDDESGVAA